MSKKRAAPHSKVTADRRVLSPDERWAAEINERIIADCHPFQRDAVEDPSRRVAILAGRHGAKTTSLRARATRKMIAKRRAEMLYLATTEDQARELNWEPLQDMNEFYGLELRFNKSEMTATCARTGSRYVMGGMEDDADVERYRGKSRDEVQIDETASHDPQRLAKLTERVVGPRVRCIVLAGSPGYVPRGPFYDATRSSGGDNARYVDRNKVGHKPAYWSSHYWNAKMVYELPDARTRYLKIVENWEEALVEKAMKGWADDNPNWLREYIGLWVSDDTGRVFLYKAVKADTGEPWNQWDPFDGHPLEGIQQLEASVAKLKAMGVWPLRFVVPADMGSSDPFACNPLAFSPRDPLRRIWHVMGFERKGMYPRTIAELLIGPEAVERVIRGQPIEPYGGVFGTTGWPDGMIFDSDQSTIDELAKVYGIRFAKAVRDPGAKAGSIALVNGDLVDGPRFFVLKDSAMEQQMEQLQWREDQFGRTKEDPRQSNHSSDCAAYGRRQIATLFESGAVEQEVATAPPGAQGSAHQPRATPPPPPGPEPDRGITSDPLRTPLHFHDPWGNV
jgi:hypothetical protein